MNEFFSFSDIRFWLYFLWFLVSAVLTFIIPAAILVGKKLKGITFLGIGIPLGIALWGWQGFIFGYLHIRWASYFYIGIFFILFIVKKFSIIKFLHTIKKEVTLNKLFLLLLILGVIGQMSVKAFMGIRMNGNIVMCCSDTSDDIWYASIASELVHHFPPVLPAIQNQPLMNYHYWSNLVVADVVRVFGLPLYPVQFQFMPLLLSATLGMSLYALVNILALPVSYLAWLLVFIYFGGDATYWIATMLTRRINFSMSSLEDGIRFLGNLPRAYAVVLYFGTLGLFSFWRTHKDKTVFLLLILGISSLAGFKVYFGIFMLGGLLCIALYDFFLKKFEVLWLCIYTLFFTALVYFPTNTAAGGFYFTGWWRFENFIVQPTFDLMRWELARLIFAQDRKWHRVLVYEFTYVAFYLVGIFGTKLLGLYQNRKSLRAFPLWLHLMLLPPLAVSMIIGLFFNQTVGGANSFNFLALVFILGSLYTALTAWTLTSHKNTILNVIISITILFFTLPRSIMEMKGNIQSVVLDYTSVINIPTQQFADFINKKTPNSSIFLVDHFDYPSDYSTTYLHFLTGRKMFLSGRMRLEVLNADYFDRQKIEETIFTSKNPVIIAKTLLHTPIDYILATGSASFTATDSAKFLIPVYKTIPNVIYQVSRPQIQSYLDNLTLE